MEIPEDLLEKMRHKKTGVYKSDSALALDEAFKIINHQQNIIEQIQSFCVEATGDVFIDKSHIRKILAIITSPKPTHPPIGTAKNLPTKKKIFREE